ncbi:MAG: hypothetical protein V4754_01085 [Pseudomonadota bacterium]
MLKPPCVTLLATIAAACILSACSPKFDWRDYRSEEAPYAALFPAKPSTYSRNINLDGIELSMTMTAAEVDGTTFAIGSAELPDPAMAQKALEAMKTALVNNIGGKVASEQATAAAAAAGGLTSQSTVLAVQARGLQNGTPVILNGKFISKDKRIYQVIVVGKEKQLVQDSVDTFLSSFKLN